MIASVSTALKLLKQLASTPNIGLSELARITQTNKSRTFRMLCSLVEEGLVQQDTQGRYHLGYQALMIGQAACKQISLVQVSEPIIRQIASQFDENFQIRIRDGEQTMQIYAHRSTQPLQVVSQMGNRRLLGMGAAGKVLLAWMSADEAEHLNPTLKADYHQLTDVRQNGFAESFGEITKGVGAIAVPLFEHKTCVACLSASVPLVRLDEVYHQALRKALLNAKDDISSLLSR
ncbi:MULTISPECIES: IclR family transcriptional regulator [unclassified Moraxella]|uniref:IclR family transcriptional regulator n=1 Tax=unclassified Moraxella TaxID=2685852 RepID=UPI002B40FA95|nr:MULTISPECIES: IclR family transcriptional regulator [unclassified Moraxella]